MALAKLSIIRVEYYHFGVLIQTSVPPHLKNPNAATPSIALHRVFTLKLIKRKSKACNPPAPHHSYHNPLHPPSMPPHSSYLLPSILLHSTPLLLHSTPLHHAAPKFHTSCDCRDTCMRAPRTQSAPKPPSALLPAPHTPHHTRHANTARPRPWHGAAWRLGVGELVVLVGQRLRGGVGQLRLVLRLLRRVDGHLRRRQRG